jgi:hypothetical protein
MLLDSDLEPGRTRHSRKGFQIPIVKVVTAADNAILGYEQRLQRSEPILGRVPSFTPNPQYATP